MRNLQHSPKRRTCAACPKPVPQHVSYCRHCLSAWPALRFLLPAPVRA
jgi:hypothetical protein